MLRRGAYRAGDPSFRRCLGTAVTTEIVIGLGAALGREAAPKLMGGARGSVLSRRFGLSAAQQRLLIARGGGVGLACALELAHGGFAILPAMIAATVAATMVVRHLDGYSIYSARLPARPAPDAPVENPGLAS
ncbi:chloride channel protein [Nocardia sp. NPDC046763]|uniref:chloride channel protein n=1 Tax=Nocardia sp. NPDC046763 TaxID=3155256 RepID=UPI0033CE33D7